MSCHIFEQTINQLKLQIRMGWDQPNQCFYGIVLVWTESPDKPRDGFWDECFPYWTSYHPDLPARPTLDEIIVEVECMGIKIPPHLLEHVLVDKRHNAANRITYYTK